MPNLFFFPRSPLWLAIGFGLVSLLLGCVSETPPDPPTRVTTQLIELLADAEPDIRRTAAMSLGKISHPQSIEALITTLSDPDSEVRQWSAWALGNLGDVLPHDALIALVQRVTDPSEAVRGAAVLALSQTTAAEDVIHVLTEAYGISNPNTQRTIVQALAQFEFPFAYPLFIQALKSSDHRTRQAAIVGLGELGDSRGLLVLRTHLLQDPNVGVRSEAAFRLGKLGSSADIPALRQAQETDPTPTVHFWATWGLTQIREEIS